MAQSHEDRKRSRRECGSCGHPDHRLAAARAVRVAYGYARAPLLPPDPPRHRPDPPGPPPGGQGGRLEVGPEVNRGEYRHKGGRLIAAEAATAADGYARGALSAPEPARGRQRSAAPWGGGSRGSSKEPAKVNREDHRHEGGSETTKIHTRTQADVTVVCYCTVGCEGAVAASADRPLPPDTRAGRTGQGRCFHAARHGGAVAAGRRTQDTGRSSPGVG